MKVAALPHPTLAASAPHSGLALQRGFGIIPEIPTYAVFLQPCQQFYELYPVINPFLLNLAQVDAEL